jgi:hypothetical protein
MEPPRHYSVSPLHSFVTVPTRHSPSFAETIRMIWRHLTGRPKPTIREQFLEAALIERLADEMEEGALPRRGERQSQPSPAILPRRRVRRQQSCR